MEIKRYINFRLFTFIFFIITSLIMLFFYIFEGINALQFKFSFVLFIISLFLIILNYRKAVFNIFKKSGTVVGLYKTIEVIIITSILILIYLLSDALSIKFDLTSSGLYRLSEESKSVVKSLTNELKILYFKPARMKGPETDYQENLIKAYKDLSRHIKIEIIDPEVDRVKAVDYDIREYGTIVLEYNNSKSYVYLRDMFERGEESGSVSYKGEIAITRALKGLLMEKPKKVYAIIGHGEADPSDKNPGGFYLSYLRLSQMNLKLSPLETAKIPEFPKDAGLIIIINPKRPFTVDELDQINNYLNEGGNALILLEFETHILINDILRNFGLYHKQNLVFDNENFVQQFGSIAVIPRILSHKITEPLIRNRLPVITPTCTALTKLNEDVYPELTNYILEISPLLSTSKYSYGETSKDEIKTKKVKQDDKDLTGPLIIGACVKRKNKSNPDIESRLVVIGDTDFINNANFDKYANSDLYLNSINFLLKREADITIRPKTSNIRGFQLTSSAKRFITVIIFIFPIIYLICGIFVVLNRRRVVKEEKKDN